MKNPAGGIGFLGAIALSVSTLFYFQPTVKAVTRANDSPSNLQTQFNNQDNQTIQQFQQTQVQTPNVKSANKTQSVSDTISFRATAYCLKGRTATGGSVRRGIIAADPRVLPLGSRIMLGAGSYSGTYTVADTGGAVKGNKLDIWVPSCSEARNFGRRTVSVKVHGKRKRKK